MAMSDEVNDIELISRTRAHTLTHPFIYTGAFFTHASSISQRLFTPSQDLGRRPQCPQRKAALSERDAFRSYFCNSAACKETVRNSSSFLSTLDAVENDFANGCEATRFIETKSALVVLIKFGRNSKFIWE
jgi:hypothetical protein